MKIGEVKDIEKLVKENAVVSHLGDCGLIVSISSKDVEKLIEAIVSQRGLDTYHQAEEALQVLLQDIFNVKEFTTSLVVKYDIIPQPWALSAYIKEHAKKSASSHKEGNHTKNLIILDEDMLHYLSENFKELFNPHTPYKEELLKLFKIEIDAIIKRIEHPSFISIEAKMFTCPLEDEKRILYRLLTPSHLKLYIEKRNSLYFLMVFSFFYDENEKIEPSEMEKRYLKHTSALPIPLSLRPLRLDTSYSPWVFHLCVLDRHVLKYLEQEEVPNFLPRKDKRTSFSSALAQGILDHIKEHQQYYLTRLSKAIHERLSILSKEISSPPLHVSPSSSPFLTPSQIYALYSKLKLNICLNYNLLKVHYMSGYIAELKSIIEQKDRALEAERKARLRAEKEKTEAEKKRLEAEKKRLEAEKKRLEAEKKRLEAEKAHLKERKERIKLEINLLRENDKEIQKKQKQIKEIEKEILRIEREINDIINEIHFMSSL